MVRLDVWSPTRESHSVKAFKSVLGLRPEAWNWHESADEARWWIVDAAHDDIPELSRRVHALIEDGREIHCALLAPNWSAVRDPVWTFIKTPLQVSMVFGWIDACLKKHSAGQPFQGQRLKLLRWPNMSRYATGGTTASAMALTVACARLLRDWADYAEIAAMAPDTGQLADLLADARREGILEVARLAVPGAAPASPEAGPEADAPRKGAWGLVKRLIKKFA